jgi:hypothetical protein
LNKHKENRKSRKKRYYAEVKGGHYSATVAGVDVDGDYFILPIPTDFLFLPWKSGR